MATLSYAQGYFLLLLRESSVNLLDYSLLHSDIKTELQLLARNQQKEWTNSDKQWMCSVLFHRNKVFSVNKEILKTWKQTKNPTNHFIWKSNIFLEYTSSSVKGNNSFSNPCTIGAHPNYVSSTPMDSIRSLVSLHKHLES